jgi:hypothetical protein
MHIIVDLIIDALQYNMMTWQLLVTITLEVLQTTITVEELMETKRHWRFPKAQTLI